MQTESWIVPIGKISWLHWFGFVITNLATNDLSALLLPLINTHVSNLKADIETI
jgi:hypothetical protein